VECSYKRVHEFESHSGEVYSIQHYVIKFVSDLRQVSVFFKGTPISFTNKTDCHDITEILLKAALNTVNPNQANFTLFWFDLTRSRTHNLPH